MRFAKLVLSLVVVASVTYAQPECTQGLAAFEKTAYAKMKKDCMECHNGSDELAPAFATNDLQQSYFRVINYSNFNLPENSTLAIRAGNGHCKKKNCDTQSGVEMVEALRAWWDQGQKECPLDGHYFTTEVAMPSDLPIHPQGFKKLQFDLAPFGNQFNDYKFQIEAQIFAVAGPTNPAAYRFRLPRISQGKRSVKVKDLKILINRRVDPLANAFTFIDKVSNPQVAGTRGTMVYPMLSDDTVITSQLSPTDKLSLSFEVFERAEPVECKNLTMFQDLMTPYFSQGTCAKCHGTGTGASFDAFSTVIPMKLVCRSVLERMNLRSPMQSSFLKTVAQGKFQHPVTLANPTLFADDLLKWTESEKALEDY